MHLRVTMALRFMRSRRKGALTRFISFASTSGIALGVFAAILGFSAMNGFEHELEHRVLSVIPSAQLNSSNEYFKDSAEIQRLLETEPQIVATAPAFEQKSILVAKQTFLPVNLIGIDPQAESKVVNLQNFLDIPLSSLYPLEASAKSEKEISGELSTQVDASYDRENIDSLTKAHQDNVSPSVANVDVSHIPSPQQQSKQHASSALPDEVQAAILSAKSVEQQLLEQERKLPHIILGVALARKLGVNVGDTLEIFTLNLASQENGDKLVSGMEYGQLKQVLQAPKKMRAKIVGLIHIGGQLDSVMALMNLTCMQNMLGVKGPNTIHIRTTDLISTQRIVFSAISGKIRENAYMTTWLSTHGKLYHDIQMVRQIMFLAMFLVLVVACFNIVSNLMMMVSEKRREIAILLTMGMSPREVIATFSLMGVLSGGYGVLIGVILGVPFSLLLTPITSRFKEWFGFDLLNPDVYFINFIPCRLDIIDLITIVTVALFMSLCSALYPAYRASHVKPAQELNL